MAQFVDRAQDLADLDRLAGREVDVVAIRWDRKQILLGECKWGTGRVGHKVLTDLIAKAPLVAPDGGEGWTVHYALFSRSGFTEAAVAEAERQGALLVDLEALGHGLRESEALQEGVLYGIITTQ